MSRMELIQPNHQFENSANLFEERPLQKFDETYPAIFRNEYVKMVNKIVPTKQTVEQLKPFVE